LGLIYAKLGIATYFYGWCFYCRSRTPKLLSACNFSPEPAYAALLDALGPAAT